MAVRRLGPAGVESRLPSIAIALPIVISKKIECAEMSDGSKRWAFFKKCRGWEISFPNITKPELDDLIILHSYNQILRWQNNDESTDWYNVVITDFDYNTADPNSPTVYYYASMTLEEAI